MVELLVAFPSTLPVHYPSHKFGKNLALSIGIFSYYKIFLKTNQQQHNVVPSPQNRTENGSVTNSVKEININRVLLYQCGHLHSSFDFPLKPAQELQLC